MTDLAICKPTKAEKEARRAERAAQQAIERQKRIDALPDSVHGVPMVEMEYTAAGTKKIKEMRVLSPRSARRF